MQGKPAHRRSERSDDRIRTAADRAAKVRFRRALALPAMTLVLPGSAQIAAGNKRVGRWAVRISLVLFTLAVGVLVTAYFKPEVVVWLGTTLWLLTWFRLLLIVLAIGWAALFIDAWRLGDPLSLRPPHRRWLVGVNGALALSVAAALFFGSHLVSVHRHMIDAMFAGTHSADAVDGRFNILLIGADSGKSRVGLRTDSLTVASVDAATGRTALIGLPRNLQNFPFAEGSVMEKQFPKGFDCDECYLNAVNTWAEDHAKLFKGSDDPGMDATLSAVEGITDLDLSYWAMVDLEGFKDMVDAVGGVEINVREEIPVGLPDDPFYTTIEPGKQELDGFELLWYARARETSDDYSRMARQKCVMNAMLQQLSPSEVIRNYQDLADATGATVSTSIPPGEVGTMADLALKAKSQRISSLSLVPPLVDDTANPDMDVIHRKIDKVIAKSETTDDDDALVQAEAQKKAEKKAQKHGVTGGSIGSLSDGYAANQTKDLSKAC